LRSQDGFFEIPWFLSDTARPTEVPCRSAAKGRCCSFAAYQRGVEYFTV
jgi:hypothetical protein